MGRPQHQQEAEAEEGGEQVCAQRLWDWIEERWDLVEGKSPISWHPIWDFQVLVFTGTEQRMRRGSTDRRVLLPREGVQETEGGGRQWALGNWSRTKSHSVGSMPFVQPLESLKQTARLFLSVPISALCPLTHHPHQARPALSSMSPCPVWPLTCQWHLLPVSGLAWGLSFSLSSFILSWLYKELRCTSGGQSILQGWPQPRTALHTACHTQRWSRL